MKEMYKICARDAVALTLVVSLYTVRRDLWLGDRYIDLDVEKFCSGQQERFFVLIKSVPVIPADIQEFRSEAIQLKNLHGIEVFLAVVEYGGTEMLVDARLQQRMTIDENRFNVNCFGGPELSKI